MCSWCQTKLDTYPADKSLSNEERTAAAGPRRAGRHPAGAIKRAMNVLGVSISPTVRGPALTFGEGAHEDAEAILEGSGLGTHK